MRRESLKKNHQAQGVYRVGVFSQFVLTSGSAEYSFVSDLSRNSLEHRFCISNNLSCNVLTYNFTLLSLMFSAHLSEIKEIIS